MRGQKKVLEQNPSNSFLGSCRVGCEVKASHIKRLKDTGVQFRQIVNAANGTAPAATVEAPAASVVMIAMGTTTAAATGAAVKEVTTTAIGGGGGGGCDKECGVLCNGAGHDEGCGVQCKCDGCNDNGG